MAPVAAAQARPMKLGFDKYDTWYDKLVVWVMIVFLYVNLFIILKDIFT